MDNLFKLKNLRVTKFRQTVYDIFKNNNSAISVNFIENELESFDRITLYRTLKLFKKKGLIHEITFANREKKLALCSDDCVENNDLHNHDHVHFHCSECNEVFCVDIPCPPKLNLTGYKIDKVEIQVIGTCVQCA